MVLQKLDCFHSYNNFGISRQIYTTLSLTGTITTSEKSSIQRSISPPEKISSTYHINVITF